MALLSVNTLVAKISIFSVQQVKNFFILEFVSHYPGNYSCPYSSARKGSRCGGRSAWSRAGGDAPICFESEVSKEMNRTWRSQH